MAPLGNVLMSIPMSLKFVHPDLLQCKLPIPLNNVQMIATLQAV